MSWTLQINNKIYDNKNYHNITDVEIIDFLSQWNNAEDSIIVQTSGSTGTPKPISLLKSDMVASAKLTGQYFDLQAGQTALHCLPVKYIAGKMILVRAIVLQLKLIHVKPASNPLLDITQKIDFAAMTPFQVKTILKQSPDKLNLIKKLIIGGAPVDASLEQELQSVKAACYSTYGMTETITHIAVKKLNGEQKSDWFEALPNITFSKDPRGCLIINTPHLNSLTVSTNDISLNTELKRFKWSGRIDNVINSGGIKIQPETIEKELFPILKNNRFFVDSLPHDTLNQELILLVESHDRIDNLKSQIESILPSLTCPKKIFFVAYFEETETGKINRKATLKKISNVSL